MNSAITKRCGSSRERMGRLLAAKEAEIQRLRAAMVHAMDDAEWGAKNEGVGAGTLKCFLGIARRIKAALEKK